MVLSGTLIPALAAIVLGAAAPASADAVLASSLRQVADAYLAAYEREDAEGTLRVIHSKSPEYEETRERLAAQFPDQDVTVALVEFRYVGHDDEFAYARIKLKTVSDAEDFADNVVDSVVLFHQENGVWKFWSDHIIGVEMIE
jgi:hypothetical protein